ncbi:unnamed protein product, partial [Mesorhabditis spiculigera]
MYTNRLPGIAAARNRALAESVDVDLLVFIDDDERPTSDWLTALLETRIRTGAGGVVGPVVSAFAAPLDPWIADGGFFDRRRLPTGTEVRVAATNNLLLDLRLVRSISLQFDERFSASGGSDSLFTRRYTGAGFTLVWCDEAVVTDVSSSRTGHPRLGNTSTLSNRKLLGSYGTGTHFGQCADRSVTRSAATGRGDPSGGRNRSRDARRVGSQPP